MGHPERNDILIALAITLQMKVSEEMNPEGGSPDDIQAAPAKSTGSTRRPGPDSADLVSALCAEAGAGVEERVARLSALGSDERIRWTLGILAQSRTALNHYHMYLDETIHPSHLSQTLREEPPRIRSIVLRHLPDQLARAVASGLDCEARPIGSDAAASSSITISLPASRADHCLPTSDIITVIHRAFVSHFVCRDQLAKVCDFDRLSSSNLLRLMRFLGIRETAIACRGISRVETLTAFLRRFPGEESRAIATQMSSLPSIDRTRVTLAESRVQRALAIARPAELNGDGGTLLDRIGLLLVHRALKQRGTDAMRYTMQKLPIEAGRELETAVEGDVSDEDCRIARQDVEALATVLQPFET
jgi:hypothetical protein